MKPSMYEVVQEENLLDELTRLVGRPVPVVREALTRLLGVLITGFDGEASRRLSAFPMTAWRAIDPQGRASLESWEAIVSAGLSVEEAFTALAVIDDHVRRCYGNTAWSRLRDWSHRLALRYDLAMPARRAPRPHAVDAPAQWVAS